MRTISVDNVMLFSVDHVWSTGGSVLELVCLRLSFVSLLMINDYIIQSVKEKVGV